jgi:hypothetical protein
MVTTVFMPLARVTGAVLANALRPRAAWLNRARSSPISPSSGENGLCRTPASLDSAALNCCSQRDLQ